MTVFKFRSVAAALATICLAGAARAESLEHVDKLAHEIEVRSRDLCLDLQRFHRRQPGYWATYKQAWELWSVSSHVHQLLHNDSNMQRVQRNTADLRELWAGVREDVAEWEAAGVICTFNLKRRLAGLDEAIEHLATDVGVPRPVAAPQPPSSPTGPPSVAPALTAPSGADPTGGLTMIRQAAESLARGAALLAP